MAGTGSAHLRPDDDVILRVDDLTVEFPLGKGEVVQAVSGVSFDIRRGETLGLVGESGCGKSTTGRAVLQLPRPTSGTVTFDGVDIGMLSDEELRRMRVRMQMILQDPISSLNPRRTIDRIVGEGLTIWGRNEGRDERIDEVLTAVGLDPAYVRDRRPHQFSGGQCQRICIARALALEPELLICDEPVSALDVSVQAQLLNLLRDMKAAYAFTVLFIAHDLAVVRNISDRVIVMYLGKICEVANADTLFDAAAHPYTKGLVRAIPDPDPRTPVPTAALEGELPSPLAPPSGCRFRTRCLLATEVCAVEEPRLRPLGDGHFVACHHVDTVVTA